MNRPLSELALVVAPRLAGSAWTPRTYWAPWLSSLDWHLDFVIDGVSVPDRIMALGFPEGYGFSTFDMCSIGNSIWAASAAQDLQQLTLGTARDQGLEWMTPGRFPLYLCSFCGDADCGALTIAIQRELDNESGRTLVCWQDPRCDDGFPNPCLDMTAFGTFWFDAGQYDAAIAEAADTLSAIAEAERLAEASWQPVRGRLRLAWQ